MGWSSPVLAKMISWDYGASSPLDFEPTPSQQSYIGCFLPLGGFIGPFFAAPMTSKLGRKSTLLISSIILISSFIVLIVTSGIYAIYWARFVQGVGNGIAMVALPIYVGEISSADCRLVNFNSLTICFI